MLVEVIPLSKSSKIVEISPFIGPMVYCELLVVQNSWTLLRLT